MGKLIWAIGGFIVGAALVGRNRKQGIGLPKRDGSGRGIRANYGRGCNRPIGRNWRRYT